MTSCHQYAALFLLPCGWRPLHSHAMFSAENPSQARQRAGAPDGLWTCARFNGGHFFIEHKRERMHFADCFPTVSVNRATATVARQEAEGKSPSHAAAETERGHPAPDRRCARGSRRHHGRCGCVLCRATRRPFVTLAGCCRAGTYQSGLRRRGGAHRGARPLRESPPAGADSRR